MSRHSSPFFVFFFFKQKTAYEMRISDWSSDVCSSDLKGAPTHPNNSELLSLMAVNRTFSIIKPDATRRNLTGAVTKKLEEAGLRVVASKRIRMSREQAEGFYAVPKERPFFADLVARPEEHTSELQSLMRISHAVFCWQ